MTTAMTGIAGKGTFAHGVHPPERKGLSADASIDVLPTPAEVKIPILQHVGAPCEILTKPRQDVAAGEMIGQSDAFISAPVHASIAGKTAMPSTVTLPNGRHVQAIPIKAEGEQLAGEALYKDILGGEWPTSGLEQYAPDDIVAAVKDAGIVGQGSGRKERRGNHHAARLSRR